MDQKIKEMIGIAAAYAGNCERCLQYHIQQGIDIGLSKKEILIAVRIADRVMQAGKSFMLDVVNEMVGELEETKPPA